jgi:phosphosulfolactate phosphohydrolase-like enzyme
VAAEVLSDGFPSSGEALAASTSAAKLREAGLGEDLRICARESTVDAVPRVEDVDAGVALISV